MVFLFASDIARSPLHDLQHQRVQIWLYDNNEFRLEAFIIVSCFEGDGS